MLEEVRRDDRRLCDDLRRPSPPDQQQGEHKGHPPICRAIPSHSGFGIESRILEAPRSWREWTCLKFEAETMMAKSLVAYDTGFSTRF
jgi:hypothetical protein